MAKTTLYSAMYGVIAQASLQNLEAWRDILLDEHKNPTNKTLFWTNRDIKLSRRIIALNGVIAERQKMKQLPRDGVPSGVRIREWEQLRFPE